jgi:nitrite reductase/ring-hydroxylating ferredoxin subunit
MVDGALWQHITTKSNAYPEFTSKIGVDVAIIGGGITGITIALRLLEAGKKVALIEARKIGEGTTGFSTGNLYIATQPFNHNIATKFNEDAVNVIAHSRKAAINYIEHNVREKNISCHFTRRPWFAYANTHEKAKQLDKEIAVLQKVGIDIQYTSDIPLPIQYKKAAVLNNQARFNPLQYVISMAEDLHKKGCLIFEKSRVIDIEENDCCRLQTAQGKIIAQNVVIATHTPIGIHRMHSFTAPYRSYVVGVHLKNNVYPDVQFWDLVAGIIIGDLILGKNNVLAKTYQANRFKLTTSVGFLFKENMNILIQYLKDFPKIETENFNTIKMGEGKVVEINGEKCGVSRDTKNQLHIVSAVCTHMKCIVNWNNAEKSWDCPCHGSRFTPQGTIIEGPA